MPRHIPYDMLQDLQRGLTTYCLLVRFDPVIPGYSSYGCCLHDQNIVYDDLQSELTYSCVIGMQPSTLISSGDLSIDGGDGAALFPEFDTPISEADLVSGAYDFSRFTAYLIDYRDLTPGRHIQLHSGTTGRATVIDGGLSFFQELRGKAQALMQSITEKWSLGCRATYGSQPGGPDRYPCNKDLTADWSSGTVDTVGIESNQSFTTSGVVTLYGGNPGKVIWTSGANTGRDYEVDEFEEESSGEITIGLTFPTMFPIQPGDTFDFRDDCPKTPAACKLRGNWANYRGEPNIPVGDAGQMSVPGASAGLGTGGRVTVSEQE